MENNLREMLFNYHNERILGDKVHVKGRKDGNVVFNDYYQIFATIESNYSRLTIDWPKNGVLPGEYQEHYTANSNRYPVEIEYFEKDDIVHLSGEYQGESYKVVIQLPEKSS